MKQLAIKCKNVHEKIAVVAMAYAAGWTYCKNTANQLLSDKHKDIYDDSYPHVLLKFDELRDDDKDIIDFVTNSWTTYGSGDYTVLTFSDDLAVINDVIFNRINSVVKISEDYDAVVTKLGIQVGCQNISFENFDKLAEVVKKFR